MSGQAWGAAIAFAVTALWGVPGGFAQEIPAQSSDQPRLIKRDFPEIQPERELRVGIFRLHPSFQTKVEYDDNIRLSDTDKKEDVLFTQTPGGMVEVRPGDHRAFVGYWSEIIRFADVTEENAVNHFVNGAVQLDLGKLRVELTDILEDSTSRLFNEDSSRDHTLLNAAKVKGRYQRGKWVLEGALRNNLVDHKPAFSDDRDRQESVATVLVGHKAGTKTALFLQADAGQVDYDSNVGNADHDYWQVMAGLGYQEHFRKFDEWEQRVERAPHTKLQAMLRVGFQDRKLSDVAGRGPQDDFDGLVSDSFIQYRPTIHESVTLGYLATAQVSTFGTNEWYRQDRVNFSWKKRLLRKLYVIPRVSWQRHDYPELSTVGGVTDRREDDIVQLQTELRYEPRVNETTGEAWAWVSLTYTFRNRDSNFGPQDFENNRVALTVSMTY